MTRALNRFNWVAPFYDQLVRLIFGDALLEAQLYLLNEIRPGDRVLILGGGSGTFLLELLKKQPELTIYYVEASSKMIALAKRKTSGYDNIHFIHATHRAIRLEKVDVIITNFFLDVFHQPSLVTLIYHFNGFLKTGGKWIVTDFTSSRKFHHQLTLKLMYFFFKITGSIEASHLPQWKSSMEGLGIRLKTEKPFLNGFVTTQLFEKSY